MCSSDLENAIGNDTNVVISTRSVGSCHVQGAFEEREPFVVPPASPLDEDISVPHTSEEIAIDIGADLELQHASAKFCEPNNLIADSCELHDTNLSEPCAN